MSLSAQEREILAALCVLKLLDVGVVTKLWSVGWKLKVRCGGKYIFRPNCASSFWTLEITSDCQQGEGTIK